MPFATLAVTSISAAVARTLVFARPHFLVTLITGAFVVYGVATEAAEPIPAPFALLAGLVFVAVFAHNRRIRTRVFPHIVASVVLWISVRVVAHTFSLVTDLVFIP